MKSKDTGICLRIFRGKKMKTATTMARSKLHEVA